ncbi:hypothetical protein [Rhodoblastus sp.]|uniref:hypothetical protein n=1 Tax=Rhodoblastus sp. TaxID=1962975 RepID=UPI003F9E3C34
MSKRKISSIGPYSRAFDHPGKDAIGGALDGRSAEGRFLRRVEEELAAQLVLNHGNVSFSQRLLIRRAARAALQLELLDGKLCSGDWNDHDARTYGGLSNNLRLTLRELGLKAVPAAKATPSLDEIAARHSGGVK